MKGFTAIFLLLFLTTTSSAFAEESPKISGFADIWYHITDEPNDPAPGSTASHPTEKKFLANAEVDVRGKLTDKVTAVLDLDIDIAVNGGTNVNNALGGDSDSARAEQLAFISNNLPVTVIGGLFNNPIGWEAEDSPDMYTFSHGQIYNILDGQTIENGNNIVGAALQKSFGPATVTVAYLDELGLTADENSYAAILNLNIIKGLDLEVSYVTAADQEDSTLIVADVGTDLGVDGNNDSLAMGAEAVIDINLTVAAIPNLLLGLEYLSGAEVVDSSYGITAKYSILENLSIAARYDVVKYADLNAFIDGVYVEKVVTDLDDTKSTTIAVTYSLDESLDILLEHRDTDDGQGTAALAGLADGDGVQTTLEFIAKF